MKTIRRKADAVETERMKKNISTEAREAFLKINMLGCYHFAFQKKS